MQCSDLLLLRNSFSRPHANHFHLNPTSILINLLIAVANDSISISHVLYTNHPTSASSSACRVLVKRPCPSSFNQGSISFLSSLICTVCKILKPEYHVNPDLMNLMRGKYFASSDGLDGISVWEKIGGDGLFSCQGANPAFLSYLLSFNSSCCKIKIVVSSGLSLGGAFILRSTLVCVISSIVLCIWSVASDMLSSSVCTSVVGEGSSYSSCTGESVEESSEENCELNDGFFFFLATEGLLMFC